MKYDFYDDISMLNSFMPNYDYNGNNSANENFTNQFPMPGNNMMNNNQTMNNNANNSLNLYSPYEGYINGNAFRDQYIPYKNYKPRKINITSEKEEMLVNIGQYSFMAHEMNLYLDVNPNNQEALNKFQEFRSKANELIKIYERKYGPLTVSSDNNDTLPFSWVTGPWPWVN